MRCFLLEPLSALPKPEERQELGAADIPFTLSCPSSDVWPAQILNFSHLPHDTPWWSGMWGYLLPKQNWLWTRLLRAWTSWKLKNPGMEMAQPAGVTCSAASLSSQFLSPPGLWPDACCAEGDNPLSWSLSCTLFVCPRSCTLPLLPRHSTHHWALQSIDKDVTCLRTDPCSSPPTCCWSLGELQLTQPEHPTSVLSAWFSSAPISSLSWPSLWILCKLLIAIIVVLLFLPHPPFFFSQKDTLYLARQREGVWCSNLRFTLEGFLYCGSHACFPQNMNH